MNNIRLNFVKDTTHLGVDFPGNTDAVGFMSGGQMRTQTVLDDAALYDGSVARSTAGICGNHVYFVPALEHRGR
jgi:hypothetical protein